MTDAQGGCIVLYMEKTETTRTVTFHPTTPATPATMPTNGTMMVYASYANDKRHVYSDFSTPWTTSECGWAKKARTPVAMNGHVWTEADRKNEQTCKKCAKKVAR